MNSSVCIYCASSNALDESYYEETRKLALLLSKNKIKVKYGGGKSGLMGAVASVYNENEPDLIEGIIPSFMYDEGWYNDLLVKLTITETMHERKQKMIENVDAAIALPGGVGTLEEVLEAITWKQLGIFLKPIILVNINGYFDKLIALLEDASLQNFIRKEHLQLFTVISNIEEVIPIIATSNNIDVSIRKLAQI